MGRGNVEASLGKSDSFDVFSQRAEYFGLRYICDTVTVEFPIMLPVEGLELHTCEVHRETSGTTKSGRHTEMPRENTYSLRVRPNIPIMTCLCHKYRDYWIFGVQFEGIHILEE
jgi:hypothetical protein